MEVISKVKYIGSYFLTLKIFLNMEFRKNTSLGFFKFMKTGKNGFFSISPILYDFEKNNANNYLSDWERLWKTSKINGKRKIILDDKILFHKINESNPHVIPLLGFSKRGKLFLKIKGDFELLEKQADFRDFVKEIPEGIIIKPQNGGGGSGISKAYVKNGKLIFEGSENSFESFLKSIKKKEYLFNRVIKQDGLARHIYPHSLNTLRVLTMMDPMTESPFIAAVVQRVGSNKTGVVDNWTAGGISIAVDSETGRLGLGAPYPEGIKMDWMTKHPDTGFVFTGKHIDNWQSIKEEVLKMSKEYYFLPYVGWDVVPLKNGFFVLEGNSKSDVNLLQIHKGLLVNSKVRAFYKYHNVTK